MVKVKNISFNPKGCLDMTKDEFKSRLGHVSKSDLDKYWNELQKEVKKHKPKKNSSENVTKRVKAKDNVNRG